MKRLIFCLGFVIMLCVTSCKTTEENYRTAYNIAREKQMDGGDSIVTAELKNEAIPKTMIFGNDTLMVRTEVIGVTKDGGGSASDLKVYNVVVAQFTQIFNAISMRDRMIGQGYAETFLIHNRMSQYYVVAGTCSTSTQAKALIEKIESDKSLLLRYPFPYVLRAAHLVR